MIAISPARFIPVEGAACDPHVRLSDGTAQRLSFFEDLPPQARVLDVGCGRGRHLKALAARGFCITGVECDEQAVQSLAGDGFDVVVGRAEHLPFPNRSFDAIVCSVVVPYTDERRVIAEWGRVLRSGGQVRASYHGVGYALKQLLAGPGYRTRLYGGRTIANGCIYRLTGRRLPGFWGDTLYQSPTRLASYYERAQLTLAAEYVRPGLGGLREIFFHHLHKQNEEA